MNSPTATPGTTTTAAAPEQTTTIPGTAIPIPVGTGVESLISINPPFRTNAPPWYTPPDSNGGQSVWSQMGCAVPQVGRYLQTNNQAIYDIVTMAGRELFDVVWGADDRKFDSAAPGVQTLWKIHEMIRIGRTRLAAKTVLDNQTPLVPTKAKPAPRMFLVYPIPLYGPLGCVNQWLNTTATMILMACTEAMQHSDNERAFYITKGCHDVIYGYLKYVLVDMAGKFFGIDQATASVDDFVIPATAWASFNTMAFSVSTETTSSRPPMGYTPTDLDLEPIRGLPVEDVIPFLQPWPDSQLKYSTGGIWAGSAGAGQTAPVAGSTTNPQLYAKNGPPTA